MIKVSQWTQKYIQCKYIVKTFLIMKVNSYISFDIYLFKTKCFEIPLIMFFLLFVNALITFFSLSSEEKIL